MPILVGEVASPVAKGEQGRDSEANLVLDSYRAHTENASLGVQQDIIGRALAFCL